MKMKKLRIYRAADGKSDDLGKLALENMIASIPPASSRHCQLQKWEDGRHHQSPKTHIRRGQAAAPSYAYQEVLTTAKAGGEYFS